MTDRIKKYGLPLVTMTLMVAALLWSSNAYAVVNISGQKTASAANVNPGDNFNYTITVTNSGDTSATGVIVTDTFNNNLTFISSSVTPASTTTSGGQTTVTWNLGTLASGQASAIAATVNVKSNTPAGTTIANSAQISGTNFGTVTTNTASVNVVNMPIISVTKVPNVSSAAPNGIVTYSISVKNTGGSSATGVTIQDTLDPKTTMVSVSPNPTTSTGGGSVTTFNVGTLAPGQTFDITQDVRVNSGTALGSVIENTVKVTGTNFDPITARSDLIVANATPTPTATPSPTPVVLGAVQTLPRTGVDVLYLLLTTGALYLVGKWIVLPSLKRR